MKPYKIRSLYKHQFLRRLRYGRGFGVHSPLGYQLIQSIAQPYGEYYAEDEFWMTEYERLLFRMIARRNPTTLHYISNESLNSALLSLAKSELVISKDIDQCTNQSLLYTNDAEIAIRFTEQCRGDILITRIRDNKEKENEFNNFVSSIKSGVIIDLFDAALFVYISDVMYLYRSTT